jgi:hypothetical protein
MLLRKLNLFNYFKLEGKIKIAKDFDAPLPDDALN